MRPQTMFPSCDYGLPHPHFFPEIWQLPCISVWLGSIDAIANKNSKKKTAWEVGRTRHLFENKLNFITIIKIVPFSLLVIINFFILDWETAVISSLNLLKYLILYNKILFLQLSFYFYQQRMRNSQVLIMIILSAWNSPILSWTFVNLAPFKIKFLVIWL